MLGLGNIGNTCGINTLLQCLYHTPGIRQAIFAADAGESTSGREVTRSLVAVMRALQNDNPGAHVMPTEFVRRLADASNGLFPTGQQHDLGELWMWLVDRVHEEVGTSQAPPSGPPSSVQQQVNQTLHRFQQGKYSAWLSQTQGTQVAMVGCARCPFRLSNIEPWTMIVLDVPSDVHDGLPVMLPDLFQSCFRKEAVDNWKCDRCEAIGGHRMCRYWSLPRTLVLLLKRFGHNMQKIHTPVQITETLTFSANSILSKPGQAHHYRLMSMGNHHGPYGGGHYTTVFRAAGGAMESWHHADDERVQEITGSIDAMLSKNTTGYLLMYDLMEAPC